MKKNLLFLGLWLTVALLNAQTNPTQATIKKTGSYTVTVYAKPASNIVNAPDINLNFAVSLEGVSGPGPTSAVSNIGGTLTAADIEVFGNRRVYPYTLSSAGINWTGGADNPVATVTFPSSIGANVVIQLNDYTGSGAAQAYWYISHSGGDQTPYDAMFYGNGAVNIQGGDSYVLINEPLPITLISFGAQKFQDRSTHLTWATSSEVNGSHFNVQRSFDNRNWSNVGRVNAVGNSQIIQNYEFMDANVYNGTDTRLTAYYRLQAVDLDGTSKNSLIKSVVFTSTGSDVGREISVYPNPSSEGVYITWDNSGEQPANLEFFDINGKLAYSRKVTDNSTQEYIDFSETTIIPGLYIVRILGKTEVIDTKQIIVEKR